MSVHNGSLWIDNNWTALPPGRWVAASIVGIAAESSTYDGLIASLIQKGIGFADVTVVFVPQYPVLQ